MDEPSKILNEPLRSELKELIREVLHEEGLISASGLQTITGSDNLLTTEQAAQLIGVKRRWLYRHSAKLPFTRRIGRKNLRFSEAGLRRWIALRKPESRR